MRTAVRRRRPVRPRWETWLRVAAYIVPILKVVYDVVRSHTR